MKGRKKSATPARAKPDDRPEDHPVAVALLAAGRALIQAAAALGAAGADVASLDGDVPEGKRKLLHEVIEDMIAAKMISHRTDRYLVQLRHSCVQLGEMLGWDTFIDAVTVAEVEKLIDNPRWSAKTKLGKLIDLRTLFSFAVKRGYCRSSPAHAIDRPQVISPPPGIHQPNQVRHVLEAAQREDGPLVSYFALGYFAGIRPAELERLTAENFRDDSIEVTAAKSKTRQRRLVTVTPTLGAWLARFPFGEWPNVTRRVRAIRRAAGEPWPQDVMRHSFCSYALPVFGSKDVALWAGHSETVLFKHYREIVTPRSAGEFWGITPAESRN